MTNQAAQTMLALPHHKGFLFLHNQGGISQVWGYTADQMRAYARAALAAPRQEGGDESDEDAHVIMMLGRLLAEIAIIVKGPEPAGTAWSYHDLPEMVRAVTQESKDVADEMQAWANVKMTERGSSRRDKLMVAEWSKRLSGAATVTFPVKDFDVAGTTLTKQEMRAVVRRVMQSPVFAGQDFGRGDSINVLYVHPAEQREPHPDALPDGTLSKSTAKRVTALAAASVSERARALLAKAYRDGGFPYAAGTLEAGVIDSVDSCALRAIEQALTQQRGNGEVVDRDAWAEALELPEGYTVEEFLPGGWHYAWTRADGERMVSGTTWNHPALAAIAAWQCAPAATPQPSADAVREYIESLRKREDGLDADSLEAESIGFRASAERMDIKSKLVRGIADELESLLGRDG